MDCIKYLNSFEEVKALISEIQNRRIKSVLGLVPPFQEYFRGQVSSNFEIKPSLSRSITDLEELESLEKEIFQDFKKEIVANKLEGSFLMNPFTAGLYKDDWYLLSQAQHCGLPTRLLDFALKWQVALYFAVEDNPKFNDDDGQFWVLSPPQSIIKNDTNKKDFIDLDPLSFANSNLINPPFFWTENYENEKGEKRRAVQHGKFFVQSLANSMTPMESQAAISQFLEKYCIPKESKPEIRKRLKEEGFTHDWLYPELDPKLEKVILGLRDKYSV